MGKSNITIRKIPLEVIIDMLVDVYNAGADFADIVVNLGDRQDKIAVIVKEEYMNFERNNDTEETSRLDNNELDTLINQSLN